MTSSNKEFIASLRETKKRAERLNHLLLKAITKDVEPQSAADVAVVNYMLSGLENDCNYLRAIVERQQP